MNSSDRSRYDELANELHRLTTCEALADWERRTAEALSGIRDAVTNANAQIEPVLKERSDLMQELDRAKFYFSQQSFLKRMHGDHSAEKTIEERLSVVEQWITTARSEVAEIENISKQLEKLTSFVAEYGPKTLGQKRGILAKLHQQKKELQVQKREATANMTAIRQEARKSSAAAGKCQLFGETGYFGDGDDRFSWYDPSVAADQRRAIRASKEDRLQPYELERAIIDRQIIDVDKRIMFVEQIIS